MSAEKRNLKDELNRCMPAAAHAMLGDLLDDIITQHNALIVKYNALLAKLDADVGVTDTNYVSTLTGAALTLSTLTERG